MADPPYKDEIERNHDKSIAGRIDRTARSLSMLKDEVIAGGNRLLANLKEGINNLVEFTQSTKESKETGGINFYSKNGQGAEVNTGISGETKRIDIDPLLNAISVTGNATGNAAHNMRGADESLSRLSQGIDMIHDGAETLKKVNAFGSNTESAGNSVIEIIPDWQVKEFDPNDTIGGHIDLTKMPGLKTVMTKDKTIGLWSTKHEKFVKLKTESKE